MLNSVRFTFNSHDVFTFQSGLIYLRITCAISKVTGCREAWARARMRSKFSVIWPGRCPNSLYHTPEHEPIYLCGQRTTDSHYHGCLVNLYDCVSFPESIVDTLQSYNEQIKWEIVGEPALRIAMGNALTIIVSVLVVLFHPCNLQDTSELLILFLIHLFLYTPFDG